MRPKYQQLSMIERIQVSTLRNLNFTYQQIADRLQISKGQVRYSLKKKDITSGRRRGRELFLSSDQVD